MIEAVKLSSPQIAHFAANGFVTFPGVVPHDVNQQFLNELHVQDRQEDSSPENLERLSRVGELLAKSDLQAVPAGAPLFEALAEGTALGNIIRVPEVRGAIESLVGSECVLDHHFVHVLNGLPVHRGRQRSQGLHQDSTIDPRERAFDIQMFYFPHEVTAEMGGTRFVPGTHLRIVSESAVARYQNVAGQVHIQCPAGTVFMMHHGIWHGGGVNRSNMTRFLYKLRLNPTEPQVRLWDTSDLTEDDFRQRPIFFVKKGRDPHSIASILTRGLPWFENDTGRIEFIQRIKFWRNLLGDQSFDADYWVTRLECEPQSDESQR